MAHISLDAAIRLLKEFDGSSGKNGESVHDFIDTCDLVYSSVEENSREILYNIIKTKLTGKARSMTKYRNFPVWDDLKIYLEDVFTEKRSVGFWQTELNNCSQSRNEDITSYANKIEKCLSNLVDAMVIGRGPEIAEEMQNLLRSQALNVFVQGLGEPLKLYVKSQRPETLENAIDLARSEERQLKVKNNTRNFKQEYSEVICNFCRKKGHLAKNCFKNLNLDRNRTPQIKNERNVFVTQTQNLICFYCKKKGHVISECRKRLYNQENANRDRNENAQRGYKNDRENVNRRTARDEKFVRNQGNALRSGTDGHVPARQ